MRIELILPVPPSTNHLFATVFDKHGRMHRAKSKEAKEYGHWVELAVIAKYGPVKLKSPVGIIGTLRLPDWKGIDLDNMKLLTDSLAKVLGFDDRRLIRNYWDKDVRKGNRPEVVVTLLDADEAELHARIKEAIG